MITRIVKKKKNTSEYRKEMMQDRSITWRLGDFFRQVLGRDMTYIFMCIYIYISIYICIYICIYIYISAS